MTDGGETRGTAAPPRRRGAPQAAGTSRPRGAPAVLGLLRAAADLVVPLECACGEPGRVLCGSCARLIGTGPVRVEGWCSALQTLVRADARTGRSEFAALLPVLALGAHRDRLRSQVLAFKNGGQFLLARPFGEALAPALMELAGPDLCALWLVPVPSSTAHRLRRGEDHTLLLTRRIARAAGLPPGRARRALAMGEGTQAGKGARERTRDRSSQVRAGRGMHAVRPGSRVVLVDDVVTTGATLRAAHRVLGEHGCEVRGALVIAAAPPPASLGRA